MHLLSAIAMQPLILLQALAAGIGVSLWRRAGNNGEHAIDSFFLTRRECDRVLQIIWVVKIKIHTGYRAAKHTCNESKSFPAINPTVVLR